MADNLDRGVYSGIHSTGEALCRDDKIGREYNQLDIRSDQHLPQFEASSALVGDTPTDSGPTLEARSQDNIEDGEGEKTPRPLYSQIRTDSSYPLPGGFTAEEGPSAEGARQDTSDDNDPTPRAQHAMPIIQSAFPVRKEDFGAEGRRPLEQSLLTSAVNTHQVRRRQEQHATILSTTSFQNSNSYSSQNLYYASAPTMYDTSGIPPWASDQYLSIFYVPETGSVPIWENTLLQGSCPPTTYVPLEHYLMYYENGRLTQYAMDSFMTSQHLLSNQYLNINANEDSTHIPDTQAYSYNTSGYPPSIPMQQPSAQFTYGAPIACPSLPSRQQYPVAIQSNVTFPPPIAGNQGIKETAATLAQLTLFDINSQVLLGNIQRPIRYSGQNNGQLIGQPSADMLGYYPPRDTNRPLRLSTGYDGIYTSSSRDFGAQASNWSMNMPPLQKSHTSQHSIQVSHGLSNTFNDPQVMLPPKGASEFQLSQQRYHLGHQSSYRSSYITAPDIQSHGGDLLQPRQPEWERQADLALATKQEELDDRRRVERASTEEVENALCALLERYEQQEGLNQENGDEEEDM